MAQAKLQLIYVNWTSKRSKFNICKVSKQCLLPHWNRQLIR